MDRSSEEYQYLKLARCIVEYLKSRYHTEAPHISVLSPEYPVIAKIAPFKMKQNISQEEEGDEEELTPEALAELQDPLKTRGHATHGIDFTLKKFDNSSSVSMETKFYIRKAPPAEFKLVDIKAEIDAEKLRVKIAVRDDDGRTLYDSQWKQVSFKQEQLQVIFAFGWPDVVREAARYVKETLYPNSEIVEISDKEFIEVISTADRTKNGEKFYFAPDIKNGKNSIKKPDSESYFAVQNFIYEVEASKKSSSIHATLILRYIAPVMISRQTLKLCRLGSDLGFPTYIYISDNRDRWSVSHLMEVESRLRWKGSAQPEWSWLQEEKSRKFAGLQGLMPIGAIAVEDDECKQSNNCIIIRDWHIETEKIPPVKKSPHSIEESFRRVEQRLTEELKSSGLRVDEKALEESFDIVLKALKSSPYNPNRLYEFQEKALFEGLKSLMSDRHKAIVLQARTAGGKTLAFLLPIVIYTVYSKLAETSREKAGGKGVKAIFFYPTIALQNDQASNIFKLLWNVNKELKQRTNDYSRVVSLGFLHGFVSKRSGGGYEQELRLTCPLCGSRLQLNWKEIPDSKNKKIFREVIKCSKTSCVINDEKSADQQLLSLMLRASREAIYSDPPDLLITNPDIINARLTLMGEEDPDSLTILGKPAFICHTCGAVYDRDTRPKKCEVCGSTSISQDKVTFSYPKIIVVDEAHLLRGAFGAQVSHLLTRLEQVIRKLNGLQSSWRPIYFVSSATLNNPEARVKELIAGDQRSIVVISAEPDEHEDEHEDDNTNKRIHVFIMPKLYSPDATLSRIVEAIYSDEISALAVEKKKDLNEQLGLIRRGLFRKRSEGKPSMLVFVNKISEANELLNYIRHIAPKVNSNGHTTDYDKDRARVEDDFSRGNLDVIVATRGLEVGVDFDRVDIGVIYGMPFYISDYTQRIGRIGRRQHSIIFNLFMPDKPVDHFYYRNWKLLSDGFLRDEHMRSEAYKISRENPEAVRRSAKRSVLDMISTKANSGFLIKQSINAEGGKYRQEIMNLISIPDSDLEDFLKNSLKLENIPEEAFSAAKNFLDDMGKKIKDYTSIRKLLKDDDALKIQYGQLESLRTIEPETKYKYRIIEKEERERNLFYSFRHCLPGQIISYRGIFYVIDTFKGNPLNIFIQRINSQKHE